MKLEKFSKEDLENMSYDDIAYEILSEKNKKMKIIDLFNAIGKILNLTDAQIEREIEDFFEMLTLDKRFIMLEDGSWDLRDRHSQNIIIEDDEDIDVELDDEKEEIEEEEEDIFSDEETDDDTEDDLKDLVIIDDEDTDSM